MRLSEASVGLSNVLIVMIRKYFLEMAEVYCQLLLDISIPRFALY